MKYDARWMMVLKPRRQGTVKSGRTVWRKCISIRIHAQTDTFRARLLCANIIIKNSSRQILWICLIRECGRMNADRQWKTTIRQRICNKNKVIWNYHRAVEQWIVYHPAADLTQSPNNVCKWLERTNGLFDMEVSSVHTLTINHRTISDWFFYLAHVKFISDCQPMANIVVLWQRNSYRLE